MTSYCSRVSFAGLFERAAAASLRPQAASLTGQPDMHNSSAMIEELTLVVSAQLEDRQEARRSIARGGRILQDKGTFESDEEEGAEQQHPRIVTDSSLNGSTAGAEGQPGDEQLSPSARYWRDRATLNGGRLSLEGHAAKLRERHQVQAELRAWCEEVLEGQQQRRQQQQQPEEADGQQSPGQPTASPAARRRSELPASPHSPRHHHRSSCHHHAQHRASCMALTTPTAAAAPEEQPTQQQEQQQQWQQQQLEQYTASAAAGGGLYLTPRTTGVFTAELQGQMQARVELEVQQRLDLAQLQQANPAEQQLMVKLQQEHQQLQQQLAQAQQHIECLQADTASNAAATTTAAPTQPGASSCSTQQKALMKRQRQKQQDVLQHLAPGVQVLTIVRSGSNSSADDPADDSRHQPGDRSTATSARSGWATQTQQQQCRDGSDPVEQQQQATAHTGLAGTPSNAKPGNPVSNTPRTANSTRPNTSDAATDAGARTASKAATRRATTSGFGSAGNSSSSSRKEAPFMRASTAAQPMSSSSATARKLVSLEQQQALVERLHQAEQVMQMLHSDLQASLEQQQQLAQQLEHSQVAEAQLRQQHQTKPQQQQQQECGVSSQAEKEPSSSEQPAQFAAQLTDMRQQLCDMQQQLAQAQQAVELAHAQQEGLQAQLEEEQADHAAHAADLQQCIEQLQQQLEGAAQAGSAIDAKSAYKQLVVGEQPATAAGGVGTVAVLAQTDGQSGVASAVDLGSSCQLQHCSSSRGCSSSTSGVKEVGDLAEEAAMQLDSGTAMPHQQHTRNVHPQLEEQRHIQQQQQQQQQLGVESCCQCKQMQQQVKLLQQELQQAGGGAHGAPQLTTCVQLSEQGNQGRVLTAASGAAATGRQQKQAVVPVRLQRTQQQLLMKTWMCPVAPELLALQALTAGVMYCEQHRPYSSRAAGTVNTWQLQACLGQGSDAADSSSAEMLPEALMLAGVRKMRPLSYSPRLHASSSMPTDGITGTALTSRISAGATPHSSRQHAVALSTGAERLLHEELLAGQNETQDRQAFLQLVGDAATAGAGCRVAGLGAKGAAVAGDGRHGGAAEVSEQQPTFTAVRWTCKSSSPRRSSPRSNTPRSARPASAAANKCDSGVYGSMLAQTSGRPQTARSHRSGQSKCGNVTSRKREGAAEELTAAAAGEMCCGRLEGLGGPPASPIGGRSMLRAGSAPLKSGAVPKLNLSVLRS